MVTRLSCILCVLLMSGTLTTQVARAQQEIIVNGDAETGDLTGWAEIVGMEVAASSIAGTIGLGACEQVGDWVFTGGLGPELQSMSQTADVSGLASEIDSGTIDSFFSVLMQSRSDADTTDLGTAILEFLDDSQSVLESTTFENSPDAPPATMWQRFTDTRTVPVGTRAIRIELLATRAGGSSTDVCFDNISLQVGSNLPNGPQVIATSPGRPDAMDATLTGPPIPSLRVVFDEPVLASADDIQLIDNQGGSVPFTLTGSGSKVLQIDFAEPLLNESYTTTISDTVTGITGLAIDGDEDGIPGGDFAFSTTHEVCGTVPAVSQWGLVVMLLLVLAAGTIVYARRRPVLT